jgi:hypothetical protein
MVDRSSTTACAGADDSNSAAANKLTLMVFMIISMGVRDFASMTRFRKFAPAGFQGIVVNET